jgi:fatty acid omega-hydroxylase
VFAGRDTTASLLTWLFYELTLQPRYYAPLEAELEAALGARGSVRDALTYEKTRSLPFMEACLMETLRKWPPVARNAKTCVRDDVWPDGTQVRAGTLVVFSSYVSGRLPEYFDEPSAWRPERWLDAAQHNGGKAVDESVHIPFHHGPRK